MGNSVGSRNADEKIVASTVTTMNNISNNHGSVFGSIVQANGVTVVDGVVYGGTSFVNGVVEGEEREMTEVTKTYEGIANIDISEVVGKVVFTAAEGPVEVKLTLCGVLAEDVTAGVLTLGGAILAAGIRAPATTCLNADSAGGVTTRGFSAPQELSSVYGSIWVEGATGGFELETVSGAVHVSGSKAGGSVRTVSGDVTLHGFVARVKTTSGSLDLQCKTGPEVRVKTVAGDVTSV